MNRFKEIFSGQKPIIGMLHLKEDENMDMMSRVRREIALYYENGINAVLVENYFGSTADCEAVLAYLRKNYPDRIYGVNILGDWRTAFDLANRYEASFIQIDSVCGHLEPKHDRVYGEALNIARGACGAAVLGGVRFKYQPVRSGRPLKEDLQIGMERCDAIVVTGEGTGIPTPTSKLAAFREIVHDFPLIVGAGVTNDSIGSAMKDAEGAIIGSWLKKGHADYGEVAEEYVREIVRKAMENRDGDLQV